MLLRNKCIVHSVIIAIDRKRAAIAECQLALPSKVKVIGSSLSGRLGGAQLSSRPYDGASLL